MLDTPATSASPGIPPAAAPRINNTSAKAAVVLTGGVFAIDYYLPVGITGGIAYVVVVLVALKHGSERFTVGLSVVCAGLTLLRLFCAPGVMDLDNLIWQKYGFLEALAEWIREWGVLLLNRFLAVFGIWITAALGVEHIRFERQLEDARDQLELRVEERTAELAKANAELRQEITDREQAEHASRDIEDRTGFIIDHALDAIIAVDTSGGVVNWNRQAETTFGWPRHEALGELLTDTIIPAQHRTSIDAAFEEFLSRGESDLMNRRLQTTALRRSGEEIPVELSITPVPWGESIMFSIFVRDLSNSPDSAVGPA
jgi:PAS domain S-box-containing protein